MSRSCVAGAMRRALWASAAVCILALALVPVASAASSAAGAVRSSAGLDPTACPDGVRAHDPFAITSDAGFASSDAVSGGTGTAADPYVISCLSVSLPRGGGGTGIAITTTAAHVVIDDVQVSGTPPGTVGGNANGITISAGTDAAIEHVTVTDVGWGIRVSAVPGTTPNVQVLDSLFENDGTGLLVNSGVPDVERNVGTGNATCIATSGGVAKDNTCSNGSGLGFAVSNGAVATGNVARDNHGNGFQVGTATLKGNVGEGNAFGVLVLAGADVEDNTLVGNVSGGVDLSSGPGGDSRIIDNVIEGNGGEGIVTNPATGEGNLSAQGDLIDGNHIGGNPFGIVLEYTSTEETVRNTDWTDGHPSFVRFSDQNTIVDAGSNQRGVACPSGTDPSTCTPVFFHDYVAAASNIAGSSLTSATFDFGDGTPVLSIPVNDLTAHTLPPDVKHVYARPGTYAATLDVHVNDQGTDEVLADTTSVTVTSPKTTPAGSLIPPPSGDSWSRLGGDPERTFYAANETRITPATVNQLVPKWRFPTSEPVTASPVVANVSCAALATPVPCSGTTQVVYDGDFAGTVYAIDAATGVPVWTSCVSSTTGIPAPSCDPAVPGNPDMTTDYGVIVASPTVATVSNGQGGKRQLVYVAGDSTLAAFDAATGTQAWTFQGGTSDPTYDIESSPIVVNDPTRPGRQMVVFGIDCNQHCVKGGGVYAVDATDGHLLWFFDPLTGLAYHPSSADVTKFDPTDVPTPSGATGTEAWTTYLDARHSATCGGVWSSPALDPALGLLYLDTANCGDNSSTPFLESVFALHVADGTPAWHYEPRLVDSRDMDFGATPTVFRLGHRDVVGVGGKDGVYYLFGAAGPKGSDPANPPIWSTKLSLGGSLGGFFNSVTDGKRIYLSSALGEASDTFTVHEDALRYREFALDARNGNVLWRQAAGPPNFGQNSLSPGIYWTGGLDHLLHAWDAATGSPMWTFPVGGAVSSAPAISDGQLFVGTGTGATYRSEFTCNADPTCSVPVGLPAPIPIYEFAQGIQAFCVASDPACTAGR